MCPFCGSAKTAPADFVDEISFRESTITGLCQECQDQTFVAHPSEMDEMDHCMDCQKPTVVRDLIRGQACRPCQTLREQAWQRKLQKTP